MYLYRVLKVKASTSNQRLTSEPIFVGGVGLGDGFGEGVAVWHRALAKPLSINKQIIAVHNAGVL
jgi:hypothetical protein